MHLHHLKGFLNLSFAEFKIVLKLQLNKISKLKCCHVCC